MRIEGAVSFRIIPAYAGSTPAEWRPRTTESGSSPHTRGAQSLRALAKHGVGIIPAYAGSTRPGSPPPRRGADHPRIRGEH